MRIFWQVGILKCGTICGTNMRVEYVFYIQFNKCVKSFLNDLVKSVLKVDV